MYFCRCCFGGVAKTGVYLCRVQDTVSEMAKDMRSSRDSTVQASAEELYQFMKRVSLGFRSHEFE